MCSQVVATGVSTSTRSEPSLIVGALADMAGGVVQTQRLALSLLRSTSAQCHLRRVGTRVVESSVDPLLTGRRRREAGENGSSCGQLACSKAQDATGWSLDVAALCRCNCSSHIKFPSMWIAKARAPGTTATQPRLRYNLTPQHTTPHITTLTQPRAPTADSVLRSPNTGTMGGFDFSNHNRNAALHAQGVPLPKATSTGTTIVGCLFDGGVVIAADTRATSGPIVADKVRHVSGYLHYQHVPNKPRTARSCTTSPPTSGAPAPAPPPTPSLPRPSSPRTSNCTPSRPAASPASSPA